MNAFLDQETQNNLQRKIFISILLPSLLPLLLLSFIVLYQFKKSFQAKVEDHLAELVQKHRQNIDAFLKERQADIQIIASVFDYDQLREKAFLQSRLRDLQSHVPDVYVDLGVVDARGRQIAYAGPFQLDDADYRGASWFRDALARETTISDVFLGKRGFPHFIVTVMNKTKNETTWILRATIDFGCFNVLVRRTRIGETGFVFLINEQGRFQTQDLEGIEPDKPPYPRLVSDLSGPVKVVEDRDQTGRSSLFVLTRLQKKNWFLIGQQKTAEAFAELHATIWIAMAILMMGGFAVTATARVLSTWISKRVNKMQQEKEAMNVQMVEAGKMAAVGELAAGIAHEINNPVAIMLEEAGWVGDLIAEEDPDALKNHQEIERALQEIAVQGRRSRDITHKLLSFARKTDSRIQKVDLGELIEEIIGVCAQKAKYSQVQIRTEVDPNLPLVQASPSEMQQVFLNMINNALDAMEQEGGRLDIHCRLGGERVVIEFKDTGNGIPPADLQRIFEPFFTTKPVGKGTGLGLSICQGIIVKMGGEIRVQSEVGKGTTFRISLPLTSSDPDGNVTADD